MIIDIIFNLIFMIIFILLYIKIYIIYKKNKNILQEQNNILINEVKRLTIKNNANARPYTLVISKFQKNQKIDEVVYNFLSYKNLMYYIKNFLPHIVKYNNNIRSIYEVYSLLIDKKELQINNYKESGISVYLSLRKRDIRIV